MEGESGITEYINRLLSFQINIINTSYCFRWFSHLYDHLFQKSTTRH
jgi:hypothetical protein